MAKGDRLNIERVITEDVTEPCRVLGYCPYGRLVEEFPLPEEEDIYACPVFGHHCPVYYLAEGVSAPMVEGDYDYPGGHPQL